MANRIKNGPIGKLHNFVVRTQRSTLRYQQFHVLSRGKQLPRDNNTRWNSMEAMISTALQPHVRYAIDEAISQNSDKDDDIITSDDWKALQKVRYQLHFFSIHRFAYVSKSLLSTQYGDYLAVIKETSKALESSTITLDYVLLAFDFLLAEFEAGKVANTGDSILSTCFNSGRSKLEKYYNKTSESSAYVAALCLNPAYKSDYFERNWADLPQWISEAQQGIRSLWESRYISSLSTENC